MSSFVGMLFCLFAEETIRFVESFSVFCLWLLLLQREINQKMYNDMKKALVTLATVAASLTVQATDYPYLAFQMADGTVQTVAVAQLVLTVSNGQLVATNTEGTKSFTLTNLSKMYFSSQAVTGIEAINTSGSADESQLQAEVFDLSGKRVASGRLLEMQLPRGIYVVKTMKGTKKISIK